MTNLLWRGLCSVHVPEHMQSHYNPVVRVQASYAIGYHGDKAIPAILKAIASGDARIRRAGLEGLSGYHSFFMEKSPFTYTHAGMEKVVPALVGVLRGPKSDMWEIEAALWAMSNADPRTIAKHLPMLVGLLRHDEWWVRSAACVAITDAGKVAEPAMGELLEYFGRTNHVSGRNDAATRLRKLIQESGVNLSPAVRRQAVAALGKDIVDLSDRERGYVRRGGGYYEASAGRLLSGFEPSELGLIADPINLLLARIGDPDREINRQEKYHDFAWVLIGDNWGNAGLIKTIQKADPATRARLMPGLKALLAGGLDKMFPPKAKKGHAAEMVEVKRQVSAMLAAHEKDRGPVRPYPVR